MYGTTIKTLLSLEEWRENIQFMPFWFAQIGQGFPSTWNYGCNDVTYQFAWQSDDMLCREEIAQAINDAEDMIARALGFPPAPKYIEGETIQYPQPIQFSIQGALWTPNGQYKAVATEYKYIQQVGVQYLTLAEAASPVTYSDEDSDSVEETFTVTATVPAGTLAREIVLFFTATDRLNKQQEFYEVRPLDVSVSGVTATIKGSKWLMVKPIKYLGINPSSLDQSVAANFVTEIDVYTRKVDISQAGSLIWNSSPYYPCDEPPCSSQINVGCFGVVDSKMGRIAPQGATWDGTNSTWVYASLNAGAGPDRVAVNYVAGYPRESNGRMHPIFAKAVTMLSCALLEKRKCGCSRANKKLDTWQNYPGEGEVGSEKRRLLLTLKKMDATWPAKNGAIDAWALLYDYQLWDVAKYG